MTALRAGLPPLPSRMQRLKVDARGYPIPYFVKWVNGVPDFRIMDIAHLNRCLDQKRCWICGEQLGRLMVFVAGPMCAINRVSSEPPSHRECAEFAVKACPFMLLPKAQRREAGLPSGKSAIGGEMIERNPGVAMLWVTEGYEVVPQPNGFVLRMGLPVETAWYAEGRIALRSEALESIKTGLPLLAAVSEGNPGAAGELNRGLAFALVLLRKALPEDSGEQR